MNNELMINDPTDWTEATIMPMGQPCMKISNNVQGLTMVAIWVRTDNLVETSSVEAGGKQ